MTDIETNDDLHSFFAEMQDVKPIKPSNKALLHDTENAIAEKKRRAARQRSEREKLKSLTISFCSNNRVFKTVCSKNYAWVNTH